MKLQLLSKEAWAPIPLAVGESLEVVAGAPLPLKGPLSLNGDLLARRAPVHGDVLEASSRSFFRYLERPWVDPPVMAELDPPQTEETWRIFADALTEAGCLAGARVLGARDEEDDRRWLWPAAALLRSGDLDVEWDHGFALRAVLRWCADSSWLLKKLLPLPLFRFVQVLEVDFACLPRAGMDTLPDRLASLMEEALEVSWPPRLELFHCGVVPAWQASERLIEACARARRSHPKFRQRAEEAGLAAVDYGQPWLELVALPSDHTLHGLTLGRRARIEREPFALRTLDDRTFSFESGTLEARRGGPMLRLREGHWELRMLSVSEERFEPLVNGRATRGCWLRHGDLLELAPSLVFRFHLE